MRAPEEQMLAQYRLLEKIGEGGMGIVYKALDTKLRRHVAIKILAADVTEEPEQRRRFMREARSAAAVNHPNIATIYEVDEVDGVAFLAMELVEGETLRTLLRRERLPIPRVLDLATRIADGLARAHRSRVVHRDLKPENVMIEADGQPKILDFGLAKVLEVRQMAVSNLEEPETETRQTNLTQRGDIMGTIAYMSPEQAQGEMVDARSDIFSFGIMLYEMVTGRLPFQGKTPMDTLAAIIKLEAIPASRVNPSIPPALDRVIKNCLEKDLRRRFQTTEALLAVLKSCEPVTPFVVRLARVARRKWALILLVVLALASPLVGPSLIGRFPGGPGRSNAVIDTIAVLPMVNLSGDPEHEPLADGFTDALISNLGRIKSLHVKARHSVMVFKNSDKPLPNIAESLGVTGLVTGTMFRSGNQVQLSIRLVDAATENVLWSTDVSRDVGDTMSFFADTALNIARQVEARISPEQEDLLKVNQRVDPEVQTLYVRAQGRLLNWDFQAYPQALNEFEQIIQLDPGFAPAYEGLVHIYTFFSFIGYQPPRELISKQRSNVMKALELDPDSVASRTSLGKINWYYQWDWGAAERAYRRALEINPNHADAHQFYAWTLGSLGRFDEAFREIEKAIELDPLFPGMYTTQGHLYYLARQYDRSVEILEAAIQRFPSGFPGSYTYLGLSYLRLGRHEEAIERLEKANRLTGDDVPFYLAFLARGYAETGELDAAQEILDRIVEMSAERYVPPYYLALIYTGLGEAEQAITQLERSYENRDPWMVFLKTEPAHDPLRAHPRFRDLLARMNFPD